MKQKGIVAVCVLVAVLAAVWGVWMWCFCRIEVPAGWMAIVTAKVGDDLPAGEILANPGQKGILREPLTEGRHFLNPIDYDWKLVRAQTIPDDSSLLSVAYDKAPTPTDHRTVQLLVWDGKSSLRRILSISWDALRGITPQDAAAAIADFLGAHLPGIPCQR